ncbi:MAG: hypothetical protein HUJ87_14845 [Fusobacterium varium]|uniref:YopX family protein n=1 Tax=Fusobacterium varium TaxID=856 RepID=UPI00243098F5|nr:YopX family protein [Fusobacterium varium]MCF0171769.1 hypothetical protein [Fusobacterium varium]
MIKSNLRFWDKKNKKMLKIEDIPTITLTEVIKNYKVMHSTGYFDKNNIEIFEGDILKIQIEDSSLERKLLCKFKKFTKKIIGIDKKRHTAEMLGFCFISDTYDTLLPITKDGSFGKYL